MRSLVTIVVDHGETTDGLQEFIETLPAHGHACIEQAEVTDWSVKVDVPSCFALRDGNDLFVPSEVEFMILLGLIGPGYTPTIIPQRCSFCQATLVNEDCPNYGTGAEHAPLLAEETPRHCRWCATGSCHHLEFQP